MPNKRFEFARVVRPTRKGEAPLLAGTAAALDVMQSRIRWLAVPAGITLACAAGFWLYFETAFGVGLSAGLRCLFSGNEAGTCMTPFETFRFWSWAVASGALSGLAAVPLAVIAAPNHRGRVRLIATLLPAAAWLWFCDWDLRDSAAWVLTASSLAGGLIWWVMLPRLLARMTLVAQRRRHKA